MATTSKERRKVRSFIVNGRRRTGGKGIWGHIHVLICFCVDNALPWFETWRDVVASQSKFQNCCFYFIVCTCTRRVSEVMENS